MNKKSLQVFKKNKQQKKDENKFTQSMLNEENKEIDKITNFLLKSLNGKSFPNDIFDSKRKKIIENKLKKICRDIKQRNTTLLNKKSSNKIGGGGDKDIQSITNEARNIINNDLIPTRTNNANVENELPIVNEVQAQQFVNNLSNNNITIRQGHRTLNNTNLNVSGQITDLGVLALQSPDANIRLRAFEALVGARENENARQRERRYLANTVFLISFIGGIVMSYQVWRVFSVITNVTGDVNGITAPAPAPSPGWGDYITGIFSGPAPPEEPPQQTWWEWIGSGGQFGLNRLFYVMHVITTFLHELIFVSKIGATMSTFILSTFVSIALWHVMDGGFSINFFGFRFSTGRQQPLQPQSNTPQLMNQREQPQQLMNQREQPQQQNLLNDANPNSKKGGKKKTKKRKKSKRKKKRKTQKKVKKRKTRRKRKKSRKNKKSRKKL